MTAVAQRIEKLQQRQQQKTF